MVWTCPPKPRVLECATWSGLVRRSSERSEVRRRIDLNFPELYYYRTVSDSSGIFHCTNCGAEYDPELKFCTKCGAKLPPTSKSVDLGTREPSGKPRGIEPPPDTLYDQPSYEAGRGSRSEEETPEELELKPYAGVKEMKERDGREDDEEKPPPPPNSTLMGFFLIISFIAPPIGLLTTIVWIFHPSYRRVVVPAILVTILGSGVWGWAAWLDMKKNIYEEPVKTISQYIEAQDLALTTRGHFLSLLDLKIDGYLPAEFPELLNMDFEIIEHVLGPTGYIVELRPGFEESRFFRMESLWTDQTGQVRKGSRDGPFLE